MAIPIKFENKIRLYWHWKNTSGHINQGLKWSKNTKIYKKHFYLKILFEGECYLHII